jgi:multicomponent Na+:H+ antiporter subunit G
VIGETIVLCGALLTLVSAIGVVRFPDALSRMHALTKASTVGFGLIAIGACLNMTNANDITSVLLAAALQLLTLPVAATLIARSTYWARRIPVHLDADDELRRAAETGTLGRRTLRRSRRQVSRDDSDVGSTE